MSGTPEVHGSSAAISACYATGAQAVYQTAQVSPKRVSRASALLQQPDLPATLPAGFRESGAWSDPVRGHPVNRGVIRLRFSARAT